MKLLFTTLLSRVRTLPRWYFFLGGTILLGIFLRTYAFRDWMIFNPDQARDALLVQDMLAGKVWPLLGPQAGNTYFSLGPIFYYFQYASAWLFGSSAERMAYPDLLFSVLAIPLFFVFTRRFFTRPLSLVLTFLFTTSFFVVTYSRFAFNPNAIPFFTLLFFLALLQILDHAPRERFGWAALLGVAMGVGFQLHTILFIAMPFLALLS
ncbi:MAG: glycosyltransferase family 39 protein, partial [Candidatus Moranbacteria bacterium]|nr:glycosyltransferase family 39 protein [Candidatus Moranbacteria bacterium]